MTLKAIASKVKKQGWEIKRNEVGRYYVLHNQKVMGWYENGAGSGDVETLKVQKVSDPDEIESDYSGGFFCDSIKQAIRYMQEVNY